MAPLLIIPFALHQPLESGWVIYGPGNGYNFAYPRLLRVKKLLHLRFFIFLMTIDL